jgi:hypothetical protein
MQTTSLNKILKILLFLILLFASKSRAQDTEISFEEFKSAVQFPLVFEDDRNYLSISVSAFKRNCIFTTELIGIRKKKYEFIGFSQDFSGTQWNVYTLNYDDDALQYNRGFHKEVPELLECGYSPEADLMVMTVVDPEEDKFYLTTYTINGEEIAAIKIRKSSNGNGYSEKTFSHYIPTPQVPLENRLFIGEHGVHFMERITLYQNTD